MKRRRSRRPPGTGSVYQPSYRGPGGKLRKSKIWWLAFHDREGRAAESAKTTVQEEAEDLLRTRLQERAAGSVRSHRVTLEQLGTMITDDYRANGRRSLKSLPQRLKPLYAWFGQGRFASEITEDKISAYVAQRLEKAAAPATVNRELAALRRMFHLAYRARKVARRPDFSLLAENNARKGFVEREPLEGVLAKLKAQHQPAVLFAYLTGWRLKSEVATLQWRHVDLKAGWVRLEPGETKSGKGRQFPVTPELRELLEARDAAKTALKKKAALCPWVFHADGRQMRYTELLEDWRQACKASGLPGTFLHDLRRSAVRNMERDGVPRAAAMAMVGHQTESMYRRYSIQDEAMLLEAAKKLTGGKIREPRSESEAKVGEKPSS